MKQITTILLTGTAAMFLSACGGSSSEAPPPLSTPAPAPPAVTPPPEVTPPDENTGLDPSGVIKIDEFLNKYYGADGDLTKDEYETTEEFNKKREDTFAPIRGNVTFLNQSAFSHIYDADTSTGKITVEFYNAVFDSSVGDTKFLGYKHNVFYETTTSGFPGGETFHPSRSDSYIIDNVYSDSDVNGNGFICETHHWYASADYGDLNYIECTYEYYAEPDVAKNYIFNSKITLNVNNSEIDHRFRFNSGNSRTLNNYIGSFVNLTILNGDNVFAKLEIN